MREGVERVVHWNVRGMRNVPYSWSDPLDCPCLRVHIRVLVSVTSQMTGSAHSQTSHPYRRRPYLSSVSTAVRVPGNSPRGVHLHTSPPPRLPPPRPLKSRREMTETQPLQSPSVPGDISLCYRGGCPNLGEGTFVETPLVSVHLSRPVTQVGPLPPVVPPTGGRPVHRRKTVWSETEIVPPGVCGSDTLDVGSSSKTGLITHRGRGSSFVSTSYASRHLNTHEAGERGVSLPFFPRKSVRAGPTPDSQ